MQSTWVSSFGCGLLKSSDLGRKVLGPVAYGLSMQEERTMRRKDAAVQRMSYCLHDV
jgi:hypothetical protein